MDPDKLNPFTLITVTALAVLQLTYEPQVDNPPEQTLPVVGTLPVHVQEEILALAPNAADTAHIRESCKEIVTGDEVGEVEGVVLGAPLTGDSDGDVLGAPLAGDSDGDILGAPLTGDSDGDDTGTLDGDTEGDVDGDELQLDNVPKFLNDAVLKQEA